MKIAILGAGKMGAWLLRELGREHAVAVHDRDAAKAAAVGGAEWLPALSDLRRFRPDLLLDAVSLPETVAAFDAAAPWLDPGCLLADVASIKGGLPAYYAASGRRFVSVHPMFGPTFADLADLRDESAVVIAESDPEGAALFRTLFDRLGLRVFDLSFAEHDRMMAYSLTVPFVASLVFASGLDTTAVPGTTFARHLGIARGLLSEDDHLLAEILFNPFSLPQLEKVTADLEYLKHIVSGRDYEVAARLFERLRHNVGPGPGGGEKPVRPH